MVDVWTYVVRTCVYMCVRRTYYIVVCNWLHPFVCVCMCLSFIMLFCFVICMYNNNVVCVYSMLSTATCSFLSKSVSP